MGTIEQILSNFALSQSCEKRLSLNEHLEVKDINLNLRNKLINTSFLSSLELNMLSSHNFAAVRIRIDTCHLRSRNKFVKKSDEVKSFLILLNLSEYHSDIISIIF